MNLVKCENEHIYDSDKFRSCPHCSDVSMDTILSAMFGAEQGEIDTNVPEDSVQEKYERVARRKSVGMLICIKGQMIGEGFCLKEGENAIGRSSNMDIALVNEMTISRNHHASIVYDQESKSYTLYAKANKSQVQCNGVEVEDSQIIKDRDVIEIGACELVLITAGDVWK